MDTDLKTLISAIMKATANRITSEPALASTSGKPGLVDRLAQKVFLKILENFHRGGLRVTLPDGQSLRFGPCPEDTAVLHIDDYRFFRKVMFYGEVGFGEAYMLSYWSSPDVTAVLRCLIENLEAIPGMSGSQQKSAIFNLLGTVNSLYHILRRNTIGNSRRNIHAHYDLSNEFYRLWLDDTMTYSSAWYGKSDMPLEEAQKYKYRKIAQSLALKPGMHVLEIGCGWGGFSLLAAEEFGVKMTAVTISEQQFGEATKRVAEAGLQDKIKVVFSDYRKLKGRFDAIVSIEMIEAVGHQYLKTYFRQCHKLLKPEGRLGLQVILCPDNRYDTMRKSADWIKRYIFPGGQLPSTRAIQQAIAKTGDLGLQHFESFGLHYAKTLHEWRETFNQRIENIRDMGYDEVFVREWNYYLAYCEAAFATHNISVAQMVFSRPNNPDFRVSAESVG